MSLLSRILEPEVMDSALDAQDYDAMDHTAVNRLFVDDFLAVWNRRDSVDDALPILDVGAGTAQIPIELCRRAPTAQVLAIDLADEMLKLARRNVTCQGLSNRIDCQRMDAKQLPLGDGSVAAVISNSIVHHVARPEAVLAEAVRACRPGGVLFFRDLLRPPDAARLQWLVETYAGTANTHQRALFAASLHAALTLAEMRTLVALLGFAPESVQQTSDRHWTWSAVRPA